MKRFIHVGIRHLYPFKFVHIPVGPVKTPVGRAGALISRPRHGIFDPFVKSAQGVAKISYATAGMFFYIPLASRDLFP